MKIFLNMFRIFLYDNLWNPLGARVLVRGHGLNNVESTPSKNACIVFSQLVAFTFLRRRLDIFTICKSLNASCNRRPCIDPGVTFWAFGIWSYFVKCSVVVLEKKSLKHSSQYNYLLNFELLLEHRYWSGDHDLNNFENIHYLMSNKVYIYTVIICLSMTSNIKHVSQTFICIAIMADISVSERRQGCICLKFIFVNSPLPVF